MSGTSLDGLDLAFCEFEKVDGQWNYSIQHAETIPYSGEWHRRLSTLESASAFEFVATDIEYGHLLGKITSDFIEKFQLQPDFVASHGHTVFHQPDKKITSQIGRGSAISAETGLSVICDFRSLDVALGGQGAPLVPIGDQLLFGNFEYCLNLGGFANISFQHGDQRIAFDVSPANIVLNHLARLAGCEYDKDGRLASGGKINRQLCDALNSLVFYHTPPPKSLSKEWVTGQIFPLINDHQLPVNDLLATFCEHIAIQVALAAPGSPSDKLMITGGGALNTFLISRIRHFAKPQIIIPDINTINYKEALIFAFLGVLRWRNEDNCMKSVTGAIRNSSGGAVY